MKKGVFKWSITGMIFLLVFIQFFRQEISNPEVNPHTDFIEWTKAPKNIEKMVRTSCYDCHSNETFYPWYSKVAPVSWIISGHVKEGRSHLNFSQWGQYGNEKQIHKLEECYFEVSKGKMPLRSYELLHHEARLTSAQADTLSLWFQILAESQSNVE